MNFGGSNFYVLKASTILDFFACKLCYILRRVGLEDAWFELFVRDKIKHGFYITGTIARITEKKKDFR